VSAQQAAKKQAVFKEAIATVANLVYKGNLDGTITESTFRNTTNYINSIKICSTNAVTEGCWGGPDDAYAEDAGVILHNGASVVGFDNITNPFHDDYLYIDWDGPNAGSNTFGDDEIQLELFFTGGAHKPGYIQAIPGETASETLFSEIFQ
jgi:hypothetical protein